MSNFLKSNKQLIITFAIVIVFTGIGYFAGTKTSQNKGPGGMAGIKTTGNNNRAGGMGGNITGEISSADEKSLTIKMTNGSSKIVLLTEKTSVNKATEAAVSDLKVGEKVVIFGSTNTDGSVTAQNVQLNPTQNVPDINQGPQGQSQPKN